MADSSKASTSKPQASTSAGTTNGQANETKPQMSDEETVLPIPDLALAQERFVLSQPKLSHLHEQAKQTLRQGIERDEMGPWLLSDSLLASQLDNGHQGTLYKSLQSKNEAELKRLQDKIEDAETNQGETELSEALRAKAAYIAKIGEKDLAIEAYERAFSKQAGLGSKIDLRLAMIRVGFFHNDLSLISSNIDKAKALIDQGGDWDRRNRLKVYQGLYLLQIRDFKAGGVLLHETMPTFTAIELIPYDDYIGLCIIAGVLSLPRKELKNKIIDSPEVIQTLPSLPHLKEFTCALYDSEYAKFFRALAEVETHHLIPSAALNQHARYYVREIRIKAYSQLLESYQSMTLRNLADAFGVSESYLENDLARFVSAGRINCSIDKVNGIVQTNRPDVKNARYEQTIKQGDVLLNSLQKLSRVIG